MAYRFEKFILDIFVNDKGVSKNVAANGTIRLLAEDITSNKVIAQKYFKNQNELTEWLDNTVTDNDAIYNKARGLLCVLNAMQ